MFNKDDEKWMRLALEQAHKAESQGEVPVGAVLVRDQVLLSRASNSPIESHDPSAHAEVAAIRLAALREQNYRLPGSTLYVTLEPCMMCVGVLVHARIQRLVFAAADPKTGMVSSQDMSLDKSYHNHRIEYQGGLLAEEAGELLRNFFKKRRLKDS